MSTDYSEDYQSPLDSSDLELDIPITYTEILDEISMDYHAGYLDYVHGISQLKSVDATVNGTDTWNLPIVKEVVSAAGINSFSDIVSKFDMQGETSLNSIVNDYSEELYGRFLKYGDYAISLQATVAEIERVLKRSVPDEDYKRIMQEIQDDPSVNSILAFVEKNPELKRIATGTLFKYGGMPVTANIPAMSEWTLETFSAASIKEWYVKFYGGGKGLADSPLVSKSVATKGLLGGLVQLGILTIKDYNKGTIDAEHMTVNVSRALASYGATCTGSAVASYLATSTTIGSLAGPIGAATALGLSLVGGALVDEVYKIYRYNEVPNPNEYQDIYSVDVIAALEENGIITTMPTLYEGESIYDTMAHLPADTIDDNVMDYIIQTVEPNSKMISSETYEKYYEVSTAFKDLISFRLENSYDELVDWPLDRFTEQFEFDSCITLDDETRPFLESLYKFYESGGSSDDPRVTRFWDGYFNDVWNYDY